MKVDAKETFSIVCVKCKRKRYFYKKDFLGKAAPSLCGVCAREEKQKAVQRAIADGVPYGVAIYTPLPMTRQVALVCADCHAVYKAKWDGKTEYLRSMHSAYCGECAPKHTARYIGVDPGSPLFLALIDEHGRWIAHAGDEVVSVELKGKRANAPVKIAALLRSWLKPDKKHVMVIENVGPMPGEGIVSAAKFVGSIWLMRGIAAALGIPCVMVTPKTWKAYYGLTSDKKGSLVVSRQMFPNRAARLKLEKDHNYAEAALLARYAADKKLGLE